MTNAELSLLIEGRTAARTGRGAQIREAGGLTQADLARWLGVTQAAVARWEAGERTPRGASAIAYGRALRKIEREVALHAV
jgi:DNA-binding transcriptional regulator YiaG